MHAQEANYAPPIVVRSAHSTTIGSAPLSPVMQALELHRYRALKKNYVLIDYENVQPDFLSPLDKDHFYVVVFVGAGQAKVSFEVASVLQQLGSRAEYVKISGNGSNALDFHIAFYIGVISSKEPEAYFHIISKDTGFDPLIQHLKSKKISAARYKAISDIPLVKVHGSKTLAERVASVIANFQQRGASRPRTLKTLGSTINALFQKSLSASEISDIIKELEKKNIVKVTDTKVAYVE